MRWLNDPIGQCALREGRAPPALTRLTQDQSVKVILQPRELQLAVGDLIQGHFQQTVLMQLAKVMDA